LESLEITVLVDNGTDSLSTNPRFVETEMARAWRRGMKWLSGRCLCCAAHGLSCLITTRTPSSQHTLLFDTGPDESIFDRNVIRLGAQPARRRTGGRRGARRTHHGQHGAHRRDLRRRRRAAVGRGLAELSIVRRLRVASRAFPAGAAWAWWAFGRTSTVRGP